MLSSIHQPELNHYFPRLFSFVNKPTSVCVSVAGGWRLNNHSSYSHPHPYRFFVSFHTHAHTLFYECSTYMSFVAERTKTCVHFSELRDVHYVQVCLQWKSIRVLKYVFQQEMFFNRAFNYFFLFLVFSFDALERLHNGRRKRKEDKRKKKER
jgi:hypothetical protein